MGNLYRENQLKLFKDKQELTEETIIKDICPEEDLFEVTSEINFDGEIRIKNLVGKLVPIAAKSHDNILTLKKRIFEKEGMENNPRLVLIFGGKQLYNSQILSDLLVFEGSLIYLALISRMFLGCVDANISQNSGAVDFEKTEPDSLKWRCVKDRGICVEGKCLNKDCVAYEKFVIVCKGICNYDIILDQNNNPCPMCSQNVKAEKYAVNNCWFGMTGILLEEGSQKEKKVTYQDVQYVYNEYRMIDPEILNKGNWTKLKIVADDVRFITERKCGLCQKVLDKEAELVTLNCSHVFDKKCLEEMRKVYSDCVLCYL